MLHNSCSSLKIGNTRFFIVLQSHETRKFEIVTAAMSSVDTFKGSDVDMWKLSYGTSFQKDLQGRSTSDT